MELANVALELRLGDPAAAADVHGPQIPALHERVNGRATDAKDVGGFFRGEEESIGGHDAPERSHITHVLISRISCALRGGLRTTVGERPAEHLQSVLSRQGDRYGWD